MRFACLLDESASYQKLYAEADRRVLESLKSSLGGTSQYCSGIVLDGLVNSRFQRLGISWQNLYIPTGTNA